MPEIQTKDKLITLEELGVVYDTLDAKTGVTGVKGDAESGSFRQGNVSLSPADIGAVSKAGGTMTGPLKWEDTTALSTVNSLEYFLGIDTFTEGGTMHRISANNLRSSIGAMPSNIANLEFYPPSGSTNGGYIDFHFQGSALDFTTRLIESGTGVLAIRKYGEDVYYPIVTTKEMSAVTTPTIGRSDYISTVRGGYVVCGRMVNFNISFTMLANINQSLTDAIINMPVSNFYGKYLCSSSGADTSTARIAIVTNGRIHIYGSFTAGTTYDICGGYLQY